MAKPEPKLYEHERAAVLAELRKVPGLGRALIEYATIRRIGGSGEAMMPNSTWDQVNVLRGKHYVFQEIIQLCEEAAAPIDGDAETEGETDG